MPDGTFTLGYDLSRLEADGHRAALMARQHGAQVARQWATTRASIGSAGSTILGGLGVPLGIGAVVAGLGAAARAAGEIADKATGMNASGESVQRLSLMAKNAGTDVDTVSRALLKMERALYDVKNAKAAESLAAFGITAKNFIMLEPDQQIMKLAEAYQEAERSGRGTSEGVALMGKTFGDLLPLLRSSAEEMSAISKIKVVSNEQIAMIDQLGDEFEKTKTSFGGFIAATAAFSKQGLTALFSGDVSGTWDKINADRKAEIDKKEAERMEIKRKKAAEIAKEAAAAAQEEEQALARKLQKEEELAKKKAQASKKQNEAAVNAEQDVRIQELRAAGRHGAASKLEKQQKEQSEFQRLRDAHPDRGEDWARALAHRKSEAEDRMANPGKIRGYVHTPPAQSGLDWLYGNNRDRGGRSMASEFKFPGLDENNRTLQRIEKHLEEK